MSFRLMVVLKYTADFFTDFFGNKHVEPILTDDFFLPPSGQFLKMVVCKDYFGLWI